MNCGSCSPIVSAARSLATRFRRRAGGPSPILRLALIVGLGISCSVGRATADGSVGRFAVVVSSDSGTPVSDAVVTLRDLMTGKEVRALTRADGKTELRPEFEGIPMVLSVAARGYLPKETVVRERSETLAVILTRAASLMGTVRATEGELPSGIVVRMIATAPPSARGWASLGLPSAPVATASRSGAFEFWAIPTSVALRILVMTPGWILDHPIEPLSVGESRNIGEIGVAPVQTLTVRCVDSDGRPAEGARVAVDGSPVATARAPWDFSGSHVASSGRCDEIPAAMTDRAGQVFLSVVSPSGSIIVDSDLHEIWRGAFDLASARTLTVRLKRASGVLSGRVVAVDGGHAEPSRSLIRVLDSHGEVAGEAYASRSGEFRVLAVRGMGPWTVMLGGPRWVGMEPMVVHDLASEIAVRVPAPVQVGFRVTGGGGDSPSSLRVVVTRLASEAGAESEVLRAEVFVNANGEYRLFLQPGTYRMRIGAAGYRWTTVPRVAISGKQSTENLETVELAPE